MSATVTLGTESDNAVFGPPLRIPAPRLSNLVRNKLEARWRSCLGLRRESIASRHRLLLDHLLGMKRTLTLSVATKTVLRVVADVTSHDLIVLDFQSMLVPLVAALCSKLQQLIMTRLEEVMRPLGMRLLPSSYDWHVSPATWRTARR